MLLLSLALSVVLLVTVSVFKVSVMVLHKAIIITGEAQWNFTLNTLSCRSATFFVDSLTVNTVTNTLRTCQIMVHHSVASGSFT